jgi:hypothetical protein
LATPYQVGLDETEEDAIRDRKRNHVVFVDEFQF